jgi:hypothetical protein
MKDARVLHITSNNDDLVGATRLPGRLSESNEVGPLSRAQNAHTDLLGGA